MHIGNETSPSYPSEAIGWLLVTYTKISLSMAIPGAMVSWDILGLLLDRDGRRNGLDLDHATEEERAPRAWF